MNQNSFLHRDAEKQFTARARIQSIKLLRKKAEVFGVFDAKKLENTFSEFAGENKTFKASVKFHPQIGTSLSKKLKKETLPEIWEG